MAQSKSTAKKAVDQKKPKKTALKKSPAAKSEKKISGIELLQPWCVAWLQSRDDPYLFVIGVLDVLPWDAENPDDRIQLSKWQSDVLQAIRDGNKRITIRSGHGVGKTTLFSWLALWAISTHLDCKVPVVASSQDQLRDTVWPEIAKWIRKLPPELRSKIDAQAERVVLRDAPDQAFIVRRTASKQNSEALQGFHASFLLFLIDEASGIEDVIFEVGKGALSTPGCIVVMAGNPTRASGYFYRSHTSLSDIYKSFRVSSEDVPRARGHIEEIIKEYGIDSNQYRVRVLGEFPTADLETVIALELAEAAKTRQVQAAAVMPYWGVDVGWQGDPSALAKRQGNVLLEPTKEWKNKDPAQLAGCVVDEWNNTPDDMKPAAIFVDVIGIGAGVWAILNEQSLPAIKVNVAEAPSQNEECFKLRDYIWWQGRKWFEARDCVCDDAALIAELVVPTYDHNSKGKIVVESKKNLKKRGVRSPNRADAFLMTLARSDILKSRLKRFQNNRPRGAMAA